jgi:hypothetical protein
MHGIQGSGSGPNKSWERPPCTSVNTKRERKKDRERKIKKEKRK